MALIEASLDSKGTSMPSGPLKDALRRIHHWVEPRPDHGPSDGELLERFRSTLGFNMSQLTVKDPTGRPLVDPECEPLRELV